MNKILLFVYGTLKDPAIQKRLIGRSIRGTSDILDNYKKIKTKNGYFNIKPTPNNYVRGLVFLVSSEELKLIDEYEMEAGYEKWKVFLRSGKKALCYRKI